MSADEQHEAPRLTPTQRLHEVTLQALSRTPPREALPRFAVRCVKGVGGATVIEWEVDVPVCDEYPTAAEAFRAARNFAEGFQQKYAQSDTLTDDLRASVKAIQKDAEGTPLRPAKR